MDAAIPPALTTGEAARWLRVSLQTVIRMCDEGHLSHFTIPPRRPGGHAHRRITREALLAAMEEFGIPPPPTLSENPR